MATSSTLGLLFEISADPSRAVAAVQGSSAEITAALAGITAASTESASAQTTAADQIVEGHARIGSSTREAREAIRGMGEELGVHMPRFVSSYLTSLGGIAPIMAMAFAPIAVIGLIEVLGRVPDAITKITDSLMGWDAAGKKLTRRFPRTMKRS